MHKRLGVMNKPEGIMNYYFVLKVHRKRTSIMLVLFCYLKTIVIVKILVISFQNTEMKRSGVEVNLIGD